MRKEEENMAQTNRESKQRQSFKKNCLPSTSIADGSISSRQILVETLYAAGATITCDVTLILGRERGKVRKREDVCYRDAS